MSVLPTSSEAPARTLKSKPSASILTISGKGASLVRTISLRVVTGTSIWRIPAAFAASGVGVKLLRRRGKKW